MTWEAFVERWREFYLMTGTAAVTLAGLLFVAISLHVDALVHETRQHLLVLARSTLTSFVFVLILSLLMLVPAQGMRITGASWILFGVGFSLITLRQISASTVDHADFTRRLFRRRLLLPLIGYAWTAVAGVLLLRRQADGLYVAVGPLCLLLGNAAGTSWDLLVRVARLKRRPAADEAGRESG